MTVAETRVVSCSVCAETVIVVAALNVVPRELTVSVLPLTEAILSDVDGDASDAVDVSSPPLPATPFQVHVRFTFTRIAEVPPDAANDVLSMVREVFVHPP